ncbi:NAD(P)/FAD-dependent oxidoreductase [Kribbella caucasensis]|uniref:NAD(P)/FAD-dependent oxidoreductase n=1 Tax=Kribbella caucasensis TaxID=2512215 RepID=UPI0010608E19|nr:NAD(P)/FAD-dependent oxidoreductase [Kribbella sp. VKM Ac-2527]
MSGTETDLLVIGAGPAGLYAAYYAGFRRYSVMLVDSLPELGGQVSALYPEKVIYDVAGFVAIKGQDLVDALVDQAATAKPQYLLGHRAEELVVDDEVVTVTTHLGAVIQAKAVLITGGIGTFTPRPLPDADDFADRGLRYFVKRLDDLAGQKVLIVGGGDSAFDWAVSLEPIAETITLIHRRPKFRAHQATVDDVLASRVEVLTPYEVARINGNARVESVEIFDNLSGERRTLPVDTVVAALGFTADLGPFTRWGLDQRKRHILVDPAMRTNLRRVFAAGDIVDYDGKVKLISVAFGEAATAVNNAAGLIEPGAKVFPGHSTGAEGGAE